jgi:hypothetical protein
MLRFFQGNTRTTFSVSFVTYQRLPRALFLSGTGGENEMLPKRVDRHFIIPVLTLSQVFSYFQISSYLGRNIMAGSKVSSEASFVGIRLRRISSYILHALLQKHQHQPSYKNTFSSQHCNQTNSKLVYEESRESRISWVQHVIWQESLF